MRLAEHIQQRFGGNLSKAARSLRETQSMCRKWALEPGTPGHHVPRPKKMAKIFRWSGGLVTPNDFYDLPELSGANPRPLAGVAVPGRRASSRAGRSAGNGQRRAA